MNDSLDERNNKNTGCLRGCLTGIIIFMVFIFSYIIYPIFIHQNLLVTSNSPDGSYEVIVKYKPTFSFGPLEINVYYKKKRIC
ncbi:hypothetical protein [Clostridium sp. ZS2-4]|uniref:hypothetical protein n=1 Tax=Clostridium sp. ZS2-4 TaxID=2987703 RepID=UPI00227D4E70|nr:hypothetical protein [Clostridium sp. ZS2-4]MCY6356335.1 hypothetical protein [Clostridium sp. ZS2-4]